MSVLHMYIYIHIHVATVHVHTVYHFLNRIGLKNAIVITPYCHCTITSIFAVVNIDMHAMGQ